MFQKLLQLYTAYMITGVTSPLPHIVGPPGTGKSTMMAQLAQVTEQKLHILNLARISPLEIEGLQMPHGAGEELKLKLLHAPIWTRLEEGDIVLFDEMLRAYPEVFNALIDIMTSRQVAGLQLPKVFMVGASNSVATYDEALEDRLIHLPVEDPRSNTAESNRLRELLVKEIGLLPDMATSSEMESLMQQEIIPNYAMLDKFKKNKRALSGTTTTSTGSSLRKLVGQARMRMVESPALRTLIEENNARAMANARPEYVLLLDGDRAPANYEGKAKPIQGSDQLSEVLSQNLDLNLMMIEAAKVAARREAIDDPDE